MKARLQDADVPPSNEELSRLRAQLLASVRRACPRWLADQAEDIVQTALVRLLGVAAERGGVAAMSASYLKRAAYNAVVDAMRRYFRRREVADQEGTVVERAPAPTAHPERSASSMDIHRGVRDCLGQLNRPQRAAVACHLLGHNAPETARFFGWTPKKVEHLLRRGLVALRACLTDKGLAP